MKKTFLTFIFMLFFSIVSLSQIIFVEGDDQNFRKAGEPNAELQQKLSQTTLGFYTQDFTESYLESYVPIGTGIAIFSVCALAYLGKKKMKKRAMLALLCLFMLCSCSKEEIVTPTRQVSFSSIQTRGEDMLINELGKVKFEEDDIVYMFASGNAGIDGRYLGALSYNTSQTKFIGNTDDWQTGETLYFYYIGDNVVNADGTVQIDLSDQSSDDDLENISHNCFVSCYETIAQNSTDRDFVGQLQNMICIAVFDTHEFDDGTNVKILSMNGNLKNIVKIKQNGTIEYGVAGINNDDEQNGHIVIGSGKSKKYVALLPISKANPAECDLFFTSNGKIASATQPLSIEANRIWFLNPNHDAIPVHATNYVSTNYVDFPSPEECMSNPHLFTVFSGVSTPSGQTTKKVVFSQGNLVYDQGRFKQHKNGWEICPVSSNSDIGVNSTFDRFGWGASGYTFGQPIYQPYANSTTGYASSVGYGYGIPAQNYKQGFFPHTLYRKQDWGWHQFGMHCYDEYELTPGHQTYWRSIGQNEWTYLFNTRSTTSTNLIDYSNSNVVTNARFVKANVEGQAGAIIFPDTYSHPSSVHLKYINNSNGNGLDASIGNNLTANEFLLLHEAGAEFLPLGSYLDKVNDMINPNTSAGYYWSAKASNSDKGVYCKINVTQGIGTTGLERYQGLFVRLVFQVEGYVE